MFHDSTFIAIFNGKSIASIDCKFITLFHGTFIVQKILVSIEKISKKIREEVVGFREFLCCARTSPVTLKFEEKTATTPLNRLGHARLQGDEDAKLRNLAAGANGRQRVSAVALIPARTCSLARRGRRAIPYFGEIRYAAMFNRRVGHDARGGRRHPASMG